MAILHRDKNAAQGFWHWCPGCEDLHRLPLGWTFNGSMEKPTFSPSFKHTTTGSDRPNVCHYILTDGVLNFCGDSLHALANKSVPLPAIPDGEIERWGL